MRRGWLIGASFFLLAALLAYLLVMHGNDRGNGLQGHMGQGEPPPQ